MAKKNGPPTTRTVTATGTGISAAAPPSMVQGVDLDEMLRALKANPPPPTNPRWDMAPGWGMTRGTLDDLQTEARAIYGPEELGAWDDLAWQDSNPVKGEAPAKSMGSPWDEPAQGMNRPRLPRVGVEPVGNPSLGVRAEQAIGRGAEGLGNLVSKIPGSRLAAQALRAGANSLPGRMAGRALGFLGGGPATAAGIMLDSSELGDSGNTALQEHLARGGGLDPRAIPFAQTPSYESMPIEGTMSPKDLYDFSGEQPWGEEGFNVPTNREEQGQGRRKVEDALRALRALKLGM